MVSSTWSSLVVLASVLAGAVLVAAVLLALTVSGRRPSVLFERDFFVAVAESDSPAFFAAESVAAVLPAVELSAASAGLALPSSTYVLGRRGGTIGIPASVLAAFFFSSTGRLSFGRVRGRVRAGCERPKAAAFFLVFLGGSAVISLSVGLMTRMLRARP